MMVREFEIQFSWLVVHSGVNGVQIPRPGLWSLSLLFMKSDVLNAEAAKKCVPKEFLQTLKRKDEWAVMAVASV